MQKIEFPIDDLVTYNCAFCFEENEIVVDPTEGLHQVLVEDCWVCCHPNVVHLDIDIEENRTFVYSEAA